MLTIRPEKIYISSANVDMRKSIDGLSAIVEQNFKLNQFHMCAVPLCIGISYWNIFEFNLPVFINIYTASAIRTPDCLR